MINEVLHWANVESLETTMTGFDGLVMLHECQTFAYPNKSSSWRLHFARDHVVN